MLGNKNTHIHITYIYVHNFISPYSQTGRIYTTAVPTI